MSNIIFAKSLHFPKKNRHSKGMGRPGCDIPDRDGRYSILIPFFRRENPSDNGSVSFAPPKPWVTPGQGGLPSPTEADAEAEAETEAETEVEKETETEAEAEAVGMADKPPARQKCGYYQNVLFTREEYAAVTNRA